MDHQLPEPPGPVPSHDSVPAEPAKRRVRYEVPKANYGKRWLITAAVVIGGRMLVSIVSDQGDTTSAAASSGCIDATKFADEMSALDTWQAEVNRATEAHDPERYEGDLRTIGGIMESMAVITADDPAIADRIRDGAAHARAAADAMAGGRFTEAQGYTFALNADWKAAQRAAGASTIPAC
jgi:hypothetical protein